MSESLSIVDYKEQLSQLCPSCRKFSKCKDSFNKLCTLKKLAFTLAKRKLRKQSLKESEV